jgi:RNA polymerase sigma-70 factor (ECF subfamily)
LALARTFPEKLRPKQTGPAFKHLAANRRTRNDDAQPSPMNLLKNILTPSDEQIMWRVRSNDDPEAFAQLVNKWQGSIQRLCVRMLGDSHRGEDLAQEAFARLYAKRADYQPAARFSTYLWRVALNLCYDELRRLKRRPETSLDIEQNDSDDTFSFLDAHAAVETTPDAEIQTREQAEIVRTALQKLPEHYRAVVVLRHYQDLKFREIAEALDIPEGTVKSRMAEGLQQLSEILTRAFRADSVRGSNRIETLVL